MATNSNSNPKRKVLKTPPVLFEKTQQLIGEIEAYTHAPLITYWNSVNGSVCRNDVLALYEILNKIGRKNNVAIFIKSDGGYGCASLQMVNLLRQFTKNIEAFIPLNCESAATMLALGANTIYMGPLANLSPVDTAIRHDLSPIDKDNDRVSVGQNELTRIIRLWRRDDKRTTTANPYESLYKYIHPLVIGSVDRATSLSNMLCNEILSYHVLDKAKRRKISNSLNSDFPAHSYPIMLREAKRLGLPVKSMDPKLNHMLIELNELYSEMGQRSRTDYDEVNHHDNEILNILEGVGIQVYYQVDTDWHYRVEERKWVSLNDKGSWYKKEVGEDGVVTTTVLHIR